MQKCDFNKVAAPFYKNTFKGMLDQVNWLVSCFWEPWPTTKLYYVYTYIALKGVLVKRCSNYMVTLALIGLKKVIEFQYMTAALLTIKSITRKLGEGSEKT